jgi:hypothetical protein
MAHGCVAWPREVGLGGGECGGQEIGEENNYTRVSKGYLQDVLRAEG